MKLRRTLAIAAVALVALAGGLVPLAGLRVDRQLSVGTIRLGVDLGHRGALDLYVPLVDWGARFDVVRLPVRLSVDVRSIDRRSALGLASGGDVELSAVRSEARDAIASYLRVLLLAVLASCLAIGALVAFALRNVGGLRLRWLLGTAVAASLAGAAALVLLLPPRGELDHPEYYANGPDIPRALEALQAAPRSAEALSEELDAQLVGVVRLVIAPAGRPELGGLPRLTLASDLHNNVLALPALERAAAGGPLFFAGDLTDRGSRLETRLVRQVVRAGRPLVFVTGNHDSDRLARGLARDGALVLTERGRLLPDGRLGPVVVRVAGLRVAGYSDPLERDGARGRAPGASYPPAERERFAEWLRPLAGRVDVVMVHAPQLAVAAVNELRADPPQRPLVLLTGHTHEQRLEQHENVLILNGGTVGAGGTGNLDEGAPIGIAFLSYRTRPRFRPLAADLVEIDPGSGSASARRTRLDLSR